MSHKITRRSFIRGIGTTAVAVAAAGVLAGCSDQTNDVVLGASSTKVIYVNFVRDENPSESVCNYKKMAVARNATSIDAGEIDAGIIPDGYKVTSTGSLEITNFFGREFITVTLARKQITVPTKDIKVTFVDSDTQTDVAETTMSVAETAVSVEIQDVKAPDGYDAIGSIAFIQNDRIVVNVTSKSKNVLVVYTYPPDIKVMDEIIKVPKSATFVTIDQIRQEFTTGKSESSRMRFKVTDSRTSFLIEGGKITVRVGEK